MLSKDHVPHVWESHPSHRFWLVCDRCGSVYRPEDHIGMAIMGQGLYGKAATMMDGDCDEAVVRRVMER